MQGANDPGSKSEARCNDICRQAEMLSKKNDKEEEEIPTEGLGKTRSLPLLAAYECVCACVCVCTRVR